MIITTPGFLQNFAAACSEPGFFGFPTWYKYLANNDTLKDADGNITCSPKIAALNDIWLVVAAVIEILLRVAALAAIALIIYGAVTLIISRGEPDKIAKARGTMLNAVIGLVIAIVSTVVVSFAAGRF